MHRVLEECANGPSFDYFVPWPFVAAFRFADLPRVVPVLELSTIGSGVGVTVCRLDTLPELSAVGNELGGVDRRENSLDGVFLLGGEMGEERMIASRGCIGIGESSKTLIL
jgi:hypothetical protein